MAISAQQLTIYLYSAHRAVIFAIAQLSCLFCQRFLFLKTFIENSMKNFEKHFLNHSNELIEQDFIMKWLDAEQLCNHYRSYYT